MRLRRLAARARRLFVCATARDKRSLLERVLCLRYRSLLERIAPGRSRGLKRVHSK